MPAAAAETAALRRGGGERWKDVEGCGKMWKKYLVWERIEDENENEDEEAPRKGKLFVRDEGRGGGRSLADSYLVLAGANRC